MLQTSIKFQEHSLNFSDQANSRMMDDLLNDLEAGIPSTPPRHMNKKMKKRKQLDALLKFRSLTSKSKRPINHLPHDAFGSSEDDPFLPTQKTTPTKLQRPRCLRWCSYTRHILSFCLVCIFMIVCAGLAYANIELKNEVQNLSLRVTEIEKGFASLEITRVFSTVEQIKTRLNVIEHWNVSKLYDRLQKLQTKSSSLSSEGMVDDDLDVSSKLNHIEEKSTQLSEVANELDKLSNDADHQVTKIVKEKTKPFDRNLIEHILEQERRENMHQDSDQLLKTTQTLNESLHTNIAKWHAEFKSLRNDLNNMNNQSIKIEELTRHFQEFTNLVQNSSDKTLVIIHALQSDLNRLRDQIEACKCSIEPLLLKPTVVDGNQLRQNNVAKPNTIESSLSSPTEKSDHNNNNTIDIAQIVEQSESVHPSKDH